MLKQLMKKITNYHNIAQQVIERGNEDTFCEVYWLLEHLPVSLIKMLTIDKLMWIKRKRGKTTLMSEPDYENLSLETISLLRYVVSDLLV